MGCLMVLLLLVLAGLLTGAAGAQGVMWAVLVIAMIAGACFVAYKRQQSRTAAVQARADAIHAKTELENQRFQQGRHRKND